MDSVLGEFQLSGEEAVERVRQAILEILERKPTELLDQKLRGALQQADNFLIEVIKELRNRITVLEGRVSDLEKGRSS